MSVELNGTGDPNPEDPLCAHGNSLLICPYTPPDGASE